MRFSNYVSDKVNLFNEVFAELKLPSMFDSPFVLIDQESLSANYLAFAIFRKNQNTVPLKIFIDQGGIRLDIFDLPETFEWSTSSIDSARHEVIEFFKRLLTSYVLLEVCGDQHSKSRIFLFDQDGNFVEKYVLRGLFHQLSGWNCDKRLFLPIKHLDLDNKENRI